MAIRVKCTGAAYRGLVNSYTGEPVGVEMVVTSSGVPLFHAAPKTYSTSDVFPTYEAALHAWNRKNGIAGVKGQTAAPRCAYTGEPLRPKKMQDGWTLDGGFDPNRLWRRDEFLGYMRMRGGEPKLELAGRVEPVRRAEPRRAASAASELTDEAVKVAEAAAKTAGVKMETSTVSMHVPRRGRR